MPFAEIDWSSVERVLVVKLRSLGDTVLATPSLVALQRFAPHVKVDILLGDWIAPILDGSDLVENVIALPPGLGPKLKIARELRRRKYDVAFNLHGGTTATFFVAASGARHRVGFAHYQYSFLYDHLVSSATDFWQQEEVHSAEQQLALLGAVGVPVDDRPRSRLPIAAETVASLGKKFHTDRPFALLHPSSKFTKQWPTENFARVAEFLTANGLEVVAAGSKDEAASLTELREVAAVPVTTLYELTLPEVTALAAQANIFVGNDSGIAHIAAAVNTPSVVVFGSSNRSHWYPWTDAPNEVVYEQFHCQPCDGYECKEYGDAPCIRNVAAERVFAAIERVLAAKNGREVK